MKDKEYKSCMQNSGNADGLRGVKVWKTQRPKLRNLNGKTLF